MGHRPAEQAEIIASGVRPAVIGSHSVGLVAGDWRVPHFVGLHALQALPLLAAGLLLLPLSDQRRWRVFGVIATIYIALFGWSVLRTLQGRSLFLLDAATTAVAATFGLAIILAMFLITRDRRTYHAAKS